MCFPVLCADFCGRPFARVCRHAVHISSIRAGIFCLPVLQLTPKGEFSSWTLIVDLSVSFCNSMIIYLLIYLFIGNVVGSIAT